MYIPFAGVYKGSANPRMSAIQRQNPIDMEIDNNINFLTNNEKKKPRSKSAIGTNHNLKRKTFSNQHKFVDGK